MGAKARIGLNCIAEYYIDDPRESIFDYFVVKVKKVSKRAVLLRIEDFEGELRGEFWFPLRFAKLIKENNCWFLEFDKDEYCKWFNSLKDRRGLLPCGVLVVHFLGWEEIDYRPLEWEVKESNTDNGMEELSDEDRELLEMILGIGEEKEEREEKPPYWVEALEELLTRFGKNV